VTTASVNRLVVIPDSVEFGSIPPAARRSVRVRILNGTPSPVQIRHVWTSCDCLTVSLEFDDLGPGQEGYAEVTIDLAKEPAFRGGLGMSVRCLAADETELLSFPVNASVAAK
jgi:hypothetical protein